MSRPGFVIRLALAFHVVGERHDHAIAIVRADQVRVRDPAVVDALAGLHRRLQFLDDVAFLDDVVLDLDAGDFRERLGERLRFVHVRVERFRHDVHLFHALRLQLRGGVDEPLHLVHLLLLRERARLELAVDPFLRCCGIGECGGACQRPREDAPDCKRDDPSPVLHGLLLTFSHTPWIICRVPLGVTTNRLCFCAGAWGWVLFDAQRLRWRLGRCCLNRLMRLCFHGTCLLLGLFALPLSGAGLTFFAAAKKVSKESSFQPPMLAKPSLELLRTWRWRVQCRPHGGTVAWLADPLSATRTCSSGMRSVWPLVPRASLRSDARFTKNILALCAHACASSPSMR